MERASVGDLREALRQAGLLTRAPIASFIKAFPVPALAFVTGALFGGFGSVCGSLVEDGFDGEEEFREIDCGPFRKPANKRLNHCSGFTF